MEFVMGYVIFFAISIVLPGMFCVAAKRLFGSMPPEEPLWQNCVIFFLSLITDSENAEKNLRLALKQDGLLAAIRYALR